MSLKIPKGGASPSIWAGTKGYFSGKDVKGMIAQGYNQDQLAATAGSTQSRARFGPNALKTLGVNTVYNYDPAQYNKNYAPFTAGDPTKVIKSSTGRGSGKIGGHTPYTLAGGGGVGGTASTVGPAAGGGGGKNAKFQAMLDAMMKGFESIKFPEPPDPQFAPGGVAAGIDTNAAGFRRKKSSARTLGLTSKGTSQFKINGQSARSAGLNIGV